MNEVNESYEQRYVVCSSRHIDDLLEDISWLIGEGWLPAGGIANSRSLYMQAMYRPLSNKDG